MLGIRVPRKISSTFNPDLMRFSFESPCITRHELDRHMYNEIIYLHRLFERLRRTTGYSSSLQTLSAAQRLSVAWESRRFHTCGGVSLYFPFVISGLQRGTKKKKKFEVALDYFSDIPPVLFALRDFPCAWGGCLRFSRANRDVLYNRTQLSNDFEAAACATFLCGCSCELCTEINYTSRMHLRLIKDEYEYTNLIML